MPRRDYDIERDDTGKPTRLVWRGDVDYPGDLAFQCLAVGLPKPVFEHRFHPTRRWRLDLAWPDRKLGVECDGGVWNRGRHLRGKGYIADCEKVNEATACGWTVLRVVPEQIKSGQALAWIEALHGRLSHGAGEGS